MEDFINELTEVGVGNVIDKIVDKQIKRDTFYQENMEKSQVLIDKLRENISQENYELLEEYIACIMNASERASTISYLVGAQTAIKFMKF